VGAHRAAIVRAHECVNFPRIYAQLGHDPEQAIAKGKAALLELYPPRGGHVNAE